MKQSIGTSFLLNFIIIFIVVTFAFIIGIMNYMKAFKVNSGISNAIENHEGYNKLAKEDISNFLTSYGYRRNSSKKCPSKNGISALNIAYGDSTSKSFPYCIYEYKKNKDGYFYYGITTYIYLDIPIINQYLAIPVYTETEKIFEYKD